MDAPRHVGRGAARVGPGPSVRRPRHRSVLRRRKLEGARSEATRVRRRRHKWDREAVSGRGSTSAARRDTARAVPLADRVPRGVRPPGPGFDAIVGNPRLRVRVHLSAASPAGYTDWLRATYAHTHGKADRRRILLSTSIWTYTSGGGNFGLSRRKRSARETPASRPAANRVRTGDRFIQATRRLKWPGRAAVIASARSTFRSRHCAAVPPVLGGVEVRVITCVPPAFRRERDPTSRSHPFDALLGAKRALRPSS